MGDSSFTPVGESDERMYGEPKIIFCGHPASEQQLLLALLGKVGLTDLPVVFLSGEQADMSLERVVAELPHKTGMEINSDLRRAVVVSGLSEKDLREFMAAYRTIGLTQPIWAALTPSSEKWTVKELINELVAEHRAFKEKQRQQQKG